MAEPRRGAEDGAETEHWQVLGDCGGGSGGDSGTGKEVAAESGREAEEKGGGEVKLMLILLALAFAGVMTFGVFRNTHQKQAPNQFLDGYKAGFASGFGRGYQAGTNDAFNIIRHTCDVGGSAGQ